MRSKNDSAKASFTFNGFIYPIEVITYYLRNYINGFIFDIVFDAIFFFLVV